MRVLFDKPIAARLIPYVGKLGLFTISHGAISHVRQFRDEEVAIYRRCRGQIADACKGDALFSAADRNWVEFCDAVEDLTSDDYAPHAEGRGLEINRRLANFLALMRLYLDHEEKRIKRSYGDGSIEALQFKNVCASAFDGHFSYRFAYRLRNFSLHHGFPIGHVQEIHTLNQSGGIEKSWTLCFDVDELLEAKSVWGSMADELLGKTPLLNVVEALDDLPVVFRGVRDQNRTWELLRLRAAGESVLNLMRDAIENEGDAVIGAWVEHEGSWAFDMEPSVTTDLLNLGVHRVWLGFDPRKTS